ncbi:MAG TPA: right-handed parallel beta-helix repeat-containing protein [Candidatus Hydrogenedentes bacterium]|nr:right-handed parallel beta-helix repeat-containing protein [Candidatus Hydrogenedentota bacterium]
MGEILKIENAESGSISGLAFQHENTQALKQNRKEWPDAIVATDSQVEIKQCRLGPSAGCGIVISGKSKVQVVQCEAQGNWQYGIAVRGKEADAILQENTCSKNANHGICIWDGGHAEVKKNTCAGNNYDGIQVDNPDTEVRLIENICEGNGWSGIRADDRPSVTMIENLCRGNTHDGIVIFQGSICSVKKNACEKNGEDGICVGVWGTQATVSGNTCQENLCNGIRIVQGAAGTVRENRCARNKLSGIALSHWDTNPVLEANECTENEQHGLYFESGCTGNARGNRCIHNKQDGIHVTDEGTAPDIGENVCEENGGQSVARVSGKKARMQDQIFSGTAGWYLKAGYYDVLERTATRLRDIKPRYIHGQPQLEYFYQQLFAGYGSHCTPDLKAILPALDAWEKAYPDSITEKVVRGTAYHGYAWSIRGPGFANTVKPEAWEGYNENLKISMNILEKAAKSSPNDPQLYTMLVDAAMSGSCDESKIEEFFNKGIEIDRSYFPLYTKMAFDLLPRWHGGRGDVEAFATRATDLTRDEYGESLYGLIAMWTLKRYDNNEYLAKHNFNWDRVKKGMEDYLAAYPSSNYHLNQFCLMACVHGDRETARALFEKIGDGLDIASTWYDEKNVRRWKRWVNGLAEPPLDKKSVQLRQTAYKNSGGMLHDIVVGLVVIGGMIFVVGGLMAGIVLFAMRRSR